MSRRIPENVIRSWSDADLIERHAQAQYNIDHWQWEEREPDPDTGEIPENESPAELYDYQNECQACREMSQEMARRGLRV